MPDNDPMTCIHQPQGLCPACQKEYDTDPSAWYDYGNHTAGIARWEALVKEMDEAQANEPPEMEDDTTIPF